MMCMLDPKLKARARYVYIYFFLTRSLREKGTKTVWRAMLELDRRFFDSGLLDSMDIKINSGDCRSVKIVKIGAKRLNPMCGRGSTSLPSRLMQTAHGARAQPARTDTAVRPYPVEHECRARAARARAWVPRWHDPCMCACAPGHIACAIINALEY